MPIALLICRNRCNQTHITSAYLNETDLENIPDPDEPSYSIDLPKALA